ncbi:pathogenicity island protein [Staphylococcus simiae CCM 7213 = CCUG 51256]|uniref:Pathogenicity island protein n=1 Tax=Staphylococcus simiae CCM 7213 = CCUG 51256 TaxID=911238 RepID=G5JF44_9STAP|nr:pathogenicity island protein [Staphylococcus simiae CCM 7213 = CCUG 51256]SNV76442.1 pathogenicity island protein [Staphylococcus simiae]
MSYNHLTITERTKEHTTSNGKTKTPDEMTVRELEDLKTST